MQGSKKDIPDLVLVRKAFPKYRKKNRERYWKLKHLNMEVDDGTQGIEAEAEDGTQAKKRGKKQKKPSKVQQNAANQKQKDLEIFYQDVEEDPEIGSQINKYKNESVLNSLAQKLESLNLDDEEDDDSKSGKKILKAQ